jgi:DTW domain-containing protein
VTRRANPELRCGGCRLHESLCVCGLIPRIETRTRLTLIIHRYEQRKPTNTGQLAAACLVNSEVLVRGHEARPSPPFVWKDDEQPLYLFPHEGAVPLARFAGGSRPVTLVVPDGTWRQAWKVRKRVAGLGEVPCVSLPTGEPSSYRLRAELHEHGLATIEAIARAMEILEGPEVRRALDAIFTTMVERSLWSRGSIAHGDVTGGVPDGAMRHDPSSGPGQRAR